MGFDNATLQGTPLFPSEIYDVLPDLLKEITNMGGTDRERDVILISALTTLSAVFHETSGKYMHEIVFPNLFSVIVAPPASGKGRVKIGSDLVHDLKLSWLGNVGFDISEEIPPRDRYLLIPANITSAALIDVLNENDGVGLIFSTEIDTLLTSLGGNYGSFSEILRQSFHAEPIQMRRKGKKEHVRIKTPRLAILLAGTPDQLFRLIPSASNGLFSRFFYSAFSNSTDFRNPNPDVNQSGMDLTQLASRLSAIYVASSSSQCTFSLNAEQFDLLTLRMREKRQDALNTVGEDFVSMINRAGVMIFKIAMILTVLRRIDSSQSMPQTLVCENVDFEIAMKMVDVMIEHAKIVFSALPEQEVSFVGAIQAFYEKLPKYAFNRQLAIQIGDQVGIAERTVNKYLRILVKDERIIRVKAGQYYK